MSKVAKIAISLPQEILAEIECEVKESGESRSQFFKKAAELLLRRKKEQKLSDGYIKAYKRVPETINEVNAAYKAASEILAQEPWD
jgi:metal-responsive CopG/Arc/MetJ family transcriptional regulator